MPPLPRDRSLLSVAACVAVLVGCGGFERRLEYVPTRSRVMNAELSYAVYTPPGFREDERLPLVLFLHGGGDDPAVFDRHGVTPRLDRAVAAGEVPRAVLVFPQGDNGFWMNWYDGTRRYEDWIVDELLPQVAARYHTARCPEGCHVMGVSMGANGALRFALHRPEQFASVTALSGPVFDATRMAEFASNRLYAALIPMHRIFGPLDPATLRREDLYLRWDDPADVGSLSIFLAWGTRDRAQLGALNERFSEHLDGAGIAHHAEEFEGNHSWVSWTPIILRALQYQLTGAPLAPADGVRVVRAGRPAA